MVKGIINAFDHMELCLVINLILVVNGLLYGHQYLLLGILVLLLPFKPGSKYLLPTKKKLIPATATPVVSYSWYLKGNFLDQENLL